jgi:hypothetical protein
MSTRVSFTPGSPAPRLLPDRPVGDPGAPKGTPKATGTQKDQPNTPADPSFVWDDLDGMAARIEALLDVEGQRTPVLLTGAWGSGKTTLMRRIQALREAKAGDRRADITPPRTVWFEAWQHAGQGALLPALCWELWKAAPKIRREDEQFTTRLLRVMRGALTASMGFAATAGGVAASLSGMPWAGALLAWLDPAKVKKYIQSIDDGAEPAGPDKPPLLALQDALSDLLKFGWTDGEEQVEPVIFIDDLDRCPPDEALALLDQVRTLLALGTNGLPCTIVFGVDRDILHQAVRHRFEALHDYDGNRYLEKVFPLALEVSQPRPTDIGDYIDHLVGWLEVENPDLPAVALMGGARDALYQALRAPVFANPRLVKRCLNRVLLLLAWNQGDPIEVETAARWIAAGERWPRLRELAVLGNDAYWLALVAYLDGKGPVPGPRAEQLLRDKGAAWWLTENLIGPSNTAARDSFIEIDKHLRRVGL